MGETEMKDFLTILRAVNSGQVSKSTVGNDLGFDVDELLTKLMNEEDEDGEVPIRSNCDPIDEECEYYHSDEDDDTDSEDPEDPPVTASQLAAVLHRIATLESALAEERLNNEILIQDLTSRLTDAEATISRLNGKFWGEVTASDKATSMKDFENLYLQKFEPDQKTESLKLKKIGGVKTHRMDPDVIRSLTEADESDTQPVRSTVRESLRNVFGKISY